MKKLYATIAFLLGAMIMLYAQPGPGPGGGGPPPVPIDGGLAFLAAAGAALGYKKLKKK